MKVTVIFTVLPPRSLYDSDNNLSYIQDGLHQARPKTAKSSQVLRLQTRNLRRILHEVPPEIE